MTTPASAAAPPGGSVYDEALAAAAALIAANAAITPAQRAVAAVASTGESVIGVRERVAAWARSLIRDAWATVNPYDQRQVDAFAKASTEKLAVGQAAVGRAAAGAIKAQLTALGIAADVSPTPLIDVRAPAVTVQRGKVTLQHGSSVIDYADGSTVTVTAKDMTTEEVMKRPAAGFRWAIASGQDAQSLSLSRIDQIIEDQLLLSQRFAETQAIAQAVDSGRRAPRGESRVTGYRRVIHPELSRGGTCGLCIAAADQIYKASQLRPIHANCKCTVAVITEDHDPGDELNKTDLAKLYEEAGGTSAAHLKRTRYKNDDHGELGAVLVPAKPYKPRSKGAKKLAGNTGVRRKDESPAEIARRHLPILESNLAALRARGLPEDDSKVEFHKTRIATMRADLAAESKGRRTPRERTATLRPPEARRPETQSGSGGGGSIPPNRFLPGGMDIPDEYPPLPDGSRVPFSPREIPRITRGDMRRVLRKHRFGTSVPNKSLFPKRWSDAEIELAIEMVMRNPEPATLKRSGDKINFERVVDGVRVRVLVRVDLEPPRFWSAYPPRPRKT